MNKYCKVCNKRDHNTEECWGLGTVCVQPIYEPYRPPATQPVDVSAIFKLKSSPEILTLIEKVCKPK